MSVSLTEACTRPVMSRVAVLTVCGCNLSGQRGCASLPCVLSGPLKEAFHDPSGPSLVRAGRRLGYVSSPPIAQSAQITSTDHLNNFRDTRSANGVGIGAGDFNQFGADVVPRVGTTLTAIQGITVGPVVCAGVAVDPNFCATAALFSTSRTEPGPSRSRMDRMWRLPAHRA